jgi:transglutaminase-like putative cysteine protease
MLVCTGVSLSQTETPQRHFTFHYAFALRGAPAGAPVKLWIPLAHSNEFQVVKIVSEKGDLPLTHTRESEYGDQMLYAESPKSDRDEYNFDIVYDVVRRESHASRAGGLNAAQRQRLLSPDKLVPTTGLPAELAVKEVAEVKGGDYDRAHAFYNYVLSNMRYDKSGTGWGHGDTLYACSAKHGNCTDFHSLFISMARSQNIPARFEIGFSVPTDKHSGEVAGYHCWADFYTRDRGWVPVDISEAWKHQEKRDYFFGHHDENRVQLAVGRDIVLSPKQSGAPLNYFVYPYVEVNGKEYSNVSNHFSFEDVGAEKTPSRAALDAR